MEQSWFEMNDIRNRRLTNSVWIPLRAIYPIEKTGVIGFLGYKSEFLGIATLAISVNDKGKSEMLGWNDVSIQYYHSGFIDDEDVYIPSDLYKDHTGELTGLNLVLEQRINSSENPEWHLHQDLVIALGLKRENDVWVSPNEGYIEIARLLREQNGRPYQIEIRSSHLRDYLCARGMVLYVNSYHDRSAILENVNHILWTNNNREIASNSEFECSTTEIHEGGAPYGSEIAVFNVFRTDIDPQEDIPVMGEFKDENLSSESWTKGNTGRKLFFVEGRFWLKEWIEPGPRSVIVRGDEVPSTIYFLTDAVGTKENRDTLINAGRWLWFKPEVMTSLMGIRGGSLKWYSRDTGSISASPDYDVHFGINSKGLINVYAKDIVQLPEWQQRIWSGFNVMPEGKVSEELLKSQVDADPPDTQAPEDFLLNGLEMLDRVALDNLGINIVRQHQQIPNLIINAHRFRAVNIEGLFALAKDLVRLTADAIDASAIQQVCPPPNGASWGSIKSLENLIALRLSPEVARKIIGPLVGIYSLRLADAHLPSSKLGEALNLVGIDQNAPYVFQGYQMLHACVSTIYGVCKIIDSWDGTGGKDGTYEDS